MNKIVDDSGNKIFLVLTGIFIASLVTCNLIANKFVSIDLGFKTFIVSAGILPYPITFLVTDLISELYGRKKANLVVFSGLIASLFVLFFLWLGAQPKALNRLEISTDNALKLNESLVDELNKQPFLVVLDRTDEVVLFDITSDVEVKPIIAKWNKEGYKISYIKSPVDDGTFNLVFRNAWRVIAASMIAYLFAQFIDVRIFHFWKNLTKGKHLWLRNNFSTIASQLVDTTLVITVLFIGVWSTDQIVGGIIDGWLFKMLVAFIDTPIFYLLSGVLRRKLKLDLGEEVA